MRASTCFAAGSRFSAGVITLSVDVSFKSTSAYMHHWHGLF